MNEESHIIKVDTRLYSKECVLKTLYWHSNSGLGSLSMTPDGYYYTITLDSSESDKSKLEAITRRFLQDLGDFAVREIVANETKAIQELLIAKAFSNGELDEEPPGSHLDRFSLKQSSTDSV